MREPTLAGRDCSGNERSHTGDVRDGMVGRPDGALLPPGQVPDLIARQDHTALRRQQLAVMPGCRSPTRRPIRPVDGARVSRQSTSRGPCGAEGETRHQPRATQHGTEPTSKRGGCTPRQWTKCAHPDDCHLDAIDRDPLTTPCGVDQRHECLSLWASPGSSPGLTNYPSASAGTDEVRPPNTTCSSRFPRPVEGPGMGARNAWPSRSKSA